MGSEIDAELSASEPRSEQYGYITRFSPAYTIARTLAAVQCMAPSDHSIIRAQTVKNHPTKGVRMLYAIESVMRRKYCRT